MSLNLNSHRKNAPPVQMAEINVTPLVDVMLVLLIVFMISAPLMQQGAKIDLPKANTGTLNKTPDQITLAINSTKKITLNGKAVSKGTLRKRLKVLAKAKPDIQVFIKANQGLSYGFIARVIAEVKKSNIHRVGLVTQEAHRQKPL